jgi:hypothetical protein
MAFTPVRLVGMHTLQENSPAVNIGAAFRPVHGALFVHGALGSILTGMMK